jgi:hypothetical protein
VALSALSVAALWKLGYFRWSNAQRLMEERKRNTAMRVAVKRVGNALRTAQTENELWHALRQGARAVGASAVWLRDENRAPSATPAHGLRLDAAAERISARFSLLGERPGAKHLILTWDDGRSEVDRDTEIAVETLCQHLSLALDRVDVESTGRFQIQRTGSA